jgi:hypothetical protein
MFDLLSLRNPTLTHKDIKAGAARWNEAFSDVAIELAGLVRRWVGRRRRRCSAGCPWRPE